MRPASRIIAAALFAAAALAGARVLAQGPGGGMGPGMMAGPAASQDWLDAAKAKLGITAGQDQAWTAYADSVRANAQSTQDMRSGMDSEAIGKMSPDQRMEYMRSLHDSRIGQMDAVSQARDGLVKVLDDRQKQLVPSVLGQSGTGMGGYGSGPGGMMGAGPDGGPSGQ